MTSSRESRPSIAARVTARNGSISSPCSSDESSCDEKSFRLSWVDRVFGVPADSPRQSPGSRQTSGRIAGADRDESAWGAVPALLLVRFPRPLAEPAVRVSTQRALHGLCRGLVQAAWARGWEQVVEPATMIGRRPSVKLGLHLRYPPSRLGRHHSVARLSALQPPISSRNHCRPSPCDRLSRPRTTTTAPPRP